MIVLFIAKRVFHQTTPYFFSGYTRPVSTTCLCNPRIKPILLSHTQNLPPLPPPLLSRHLIEILTSDKGKSATIPHAYAPVALDQASWNGLDWSRFLGPLEHPSFCPTDLPHGICDMCHGLAYCQGSSIIFPCSISCSLICLCNKRQHRG